MDLKKEAERISLGQDLNKTFRQAVEICKQLAALKETLLQIKSRMVNSPSLYKEADITSVEGTIVALDAQIKEI